MKDNGRFTSLGDRMKEYENHGRNYHMARTPVILRIDGKAFHSFTRGLERPFDIKLLECMRRATEEVAKEISGCKLAYTQSDESSFLITDWNSDHTEGWFKYNKSKIESVSASIFTAYFNDFFKEAFPERIKNLALFDARSFNLPKEEVINYFIWRQWDSTRNAIQMVARANFSHTQCENKNTSELQEMLFTEKGLNFDDTPVQFKRGVGLYKQYKTEPNAYYGKYKNQSEMVTRGYWHTDLHLPNFPRSREWFAQLTDIPESIPRENGFFATTEIELKPIDLIIEE